MSWDLLQCSMFVAHTNGVVAQQTCHPALQHHTPTNAYLQMPPLFFDVGGRYATTGTPLFLEQTTIQCGHNYACNFFCLTPRLRESCCWTIKESIAKKVGTKWCCLSRPPVGNCGQASALFFAKLYFLVGDPCDGNKFHFVPVALFSRTSKPT